MRLDVDYPTYSKKGRGIVSQSTESSSFDCPFGTFWLSFVTFQIIKYQTGFPFMKLERSRVNIRLLLILMRYHHPGFWYPLTSPTSSKSNFWYIYRADDMWRKMGFSVGPFSLFMAANSCLEPMYRKHGIFVQKLWICPLIFLIQHQIQHKMHSTPLQF